MLAPHALRDGLYAAACGRDLVLLDTCAGSYDLAPGVAVGLKVGLSGADLCFEAPGLAAAFDEAGLLAASARGSLPALPVLPRCSALSDPARPLRAGLAHHSRALIEMAHSYYRRPLPHLIARVRAKEPANADTDPSVIAAHAKSFDRWLAWTPRQGACVYRAFMLRRWLQAAGIGGVSWVFGVRTWPFYAHCWLQVGDLSLTDHAEALVAFTPIFAV